MKNLGKLGLLSGFALGAVGYIICGIIDRTDIAELVMILCIPVGPAITWFIGRLSAKKSHSDGKQTDDMNLLK